MSADPPVVLDHRGDRPARSRGGEAVRRRRRAARPRRHATAAAWPPSPPRPALADDAWLPVVGDLRDREAARRRGRGRRGSASGGSTSSCTSSAAGRAGRRWSTSTPTRSRSMLDQHLWTTFHLVQAVVPGMVERGFGRLLAVSSPFAANPGPKGAGYAIAKAAEELLLRSLAREVAGSGRHGERRGRPQDRLRSTSARRRRTRRTPPGRRPRRSRTRSRSSRRRRRPR